jgi:hypothetical protein
MSNQALPSEPKVHLELSLGQAQDLNRALDVYVRIGIGQVETIAELMRWDQITPAAAGVEMSLELLDGVERRLLELKALLGHARGASLGIGSPKSTLSVRRAYEMKKAMSKALAEHREPSPAFKGVDYDGLFIRYTKDDPPVVTVVTCNEDVEDKSQ